MSFTANVVIVNIFGSSLEQVEGIPVRYGREALWRRAQTPETRRCIYHSQDDATVKALQSIVIVHLCSLSFAPQYLFGQRRFTVGG